MLTCGVIWLKTLKKAELLMCAELLLTLVNRIVHMVKGLEFYLIHILTVGWYALAGTLCK